jgi:hypothetical protein
MPPSTALSTRPGLIGQRQRRQRIHPTAQRARSQYNSEDRLKTRAHIQRLLLRVEEEVRQAAWIAREEASDRSAKLPPERRSRCGASVS